MLGARDEAGLERTRKMVRRHDAAVLIQSTDVTQPEQCRQLVRIAVDTFGQIDILVLNAGISMWSRFDEVTDLELFGRLIKVNYLGAVYCVHAALPHLRHQRGTIVAISSTQAVIGLPHHSGYSASKHALRGFLEALELEMDGEIRIFNVLPGWVQGTNIRQNALGGDGGPVGPAERPHRHESVSLEECSAAIVRGLQQSVRDLYIPAKLRFIPWLKLLARGWLGSRIKKAVAMQ